MDTRHVPVSSSLQAPLDAADAWRTACATSFPRLTLLTNAQRLHVGDIAGFAARLTGGRALHHSRSVELSAPRPPCALPGALRVRGFTPANLAQPHPEMRPASYRAVYRWGETWQASPFPGETPARPLAGNHWQLNGVAAAAWALEGSEPVVTIVADCIQLARLNFIGQVFNGDNRVSPADGVKAGETLRPET